MAERIPKISVVIPTYNRADKLNRCLTSLVNQDFKEFEVLVCDDGSTDGTRQVVHSFSKSLDITYLYAERFGGPAVPRNRGIKSARGLYIAFLDSDDWWRPEKLRISYATLNLGCDFVCHDLYRTSKNNQIIFFLKVKSRSFKGRLFMDLISHGNGIINSSVVVRKDLLDSVGGFSEDLELIGAEDFDCWLKIAKLTDRCEKIPCTLGYYWTGGGNLTNPARTLMNLRFIEFKYFSCFYELFENRGVWWMHYAKGVSYSRLRMHTMAINELRAINFNSAPPVYYLHAQLIILLKKIIINLRLST